MKKFTVLIFLFVCAIGFSQRSNSSSSEAMNELLNRYDQIGSQSGNISDFFTSEEQQMLKDHFAGNNASTNYVPLFHDVLGSTNLSISDPNARVVERPINMRAATQVYANEAVTTLSHNTDNVITGTNSVACGGGDNSQARVFNLGSFGITDEFTITDGEIGVQSISNNLDVTVNIWDLDLANFPVGFPAGSTLIGTETVTIPLGSDLSIVNYTFSTPVVVPAGTSDILVEVIQPADGTSWFIGGTAAETDDSWIASGTCGLAEYSTTTAIGFPDAHYYITVTGDTAGGPPSGPAVAYSPESQALMFGSFDPAAPAVFNPIGPSIPTAGFEGAGAIDPNDPATAYVMTNLGEFYSLDVASGVYTFLGNVNQPGAETAVGLEFDPTTGTLYMLSTDAVTSTLSTIDIAGLTSTPVGGASGMALAIALAIDGSGNGWAYDILDDNFYSVDLATGAAAVVGSIGFDANFGQGMTWDSDTDTVYMTAFNAGLFDSEFRSVDLATGATTLIDGMQPGVLTQYAWVGIVGGTTPPPPSICTTSTPYDSTAVPFDIDGTGTSTADCTNAPNLVPVTVGDAGIIGTDAEIENVTINITHTWSGDLELYLVSPSGTELLMWENVGGSGDNFTDTQFEDGGMPTAGSTAPHTGVYQPVGGDFATTFAGEDITGDWNLKVCDDFGGDSGTVDSFTLTLCITPPVDNDTCANATVVACGDTVAGDTSNNTDQGGNNASPDEWFSFTGTGAAEFVTLSLCDGGTTYDSRLTVFDACGGAIIATNDDSCGLQSELTFTSDGVSTYYIAVEGFSSSSSGPFSLAVTCALVPPPPPNDECVNAIEVNCGDFISGTTNDATIDDAVAPTCDTAVTSPGVWYVLNDDSGLVTDITITMCTGSTSYDSKLSVYTGDCGAPPLTCVAGNDDTCGLQSEVSFQSDGNTTFYILVHGFGGATGDFELDIQCTPVPPPNDMIVNSIDVDEIGFPYTDPQVAMPAATVEAGGTPAGCDNAGAKGVWYNFVPEGDGEATATIVTPGVGGTNFSVNNGPLAGDYTVVPASFGGAIPSTPLTEDTAVVMDDDTTGDPNDACDPINNGSALNGKIAIVRRGACEFGVKALAAQNEGAVAVLVVNNQPGDPIVMGGGAVGDQVTIPVVMISDVDGEPIIAEVLGGGTVNVTLFSDPAGFSSVTFYTAPDENAVETDLTLVDYWDNQCVPGIDASIPTVAGQAYYVYVVNHGAITDIIIDGTNLGASDNTIEGFSYYPNPAMDAINLQSVDMIEDVAIFNMLGQRVVNQSVSATTSQISVSHLATGTYVMKVTVNGQVGTYKVIKK